MPKSPGSGARKRGAAASGAPRAGLEQLRLFVEHSPAAIAMLDRDMRYVLVSRRWISDYRLGDLDLIGRSHYEVFPEVPERWREIHRRCLAGAVESSPGEAFARADGSVDWVRWEIHPWRSGREVGGLLIFSEVITERVRTEQALREGRERFIGIVESAMDAIVSADENQRIVLFNSAAEKIFGYTEDAVLGRPLDLLIPQAHRAGHAASVQHFGANGETARAMGALGSVVGLRADGSEVPLEVSISKTAVGGHVIYTAILRDISQRLAFRRELRDAAERLRQLSHRLVDAQELEQRRISTELHDRIGQNLTALGLNLQAIAALDPARAEKLAAFVADSRALLQSTMGVVRGLIAEIRPTALYEYGLLAGLRALGRDFAARGGIATAVEGAEAEPRLPASAELALYRIVQEALNNALKHSGARRISIRLQPTADGAELSVEDDGRGFDQTATVPGTTKHWGLLMMQERAEAVGARLDIEAAPGRGARIVVRAARDGRAPGSLLPRDPEQWQDRLNP